MMNHELSADRDHGPRTAGHGLRAGDYGRRSHSSFIIHPSSFAGFTLIELLIVVAIMATLAAMTFPVMSAVKRQMIRTRARGGLTQIETAIEAYNSKFGQYPPDTTWPTPVPPDAWATNQLYYELLGTTNILNPTRYQTLDGSATMLAANVSIVFHNVSGFMNCSLPSNGDDAGTGMNFLKGGLKANQFAPVTINNVSNVCVLGAALEGPVYLDTADNKKINPWRYNSSNPVHNPKTFDLWMDVLVGGKTNRISNWSDQAILVSTPYP